MRYYKYGAIIILFSLFVDFFAFLQFTVVLKLPMQPHFFIIPSLLGFIFGTILVVSRYFYHKSKDRELFEMIAKTDHLTGALSRYSFDILYKMEFERFLRTKRPFSLIMFDLDDFKQINDRFGHTTGDRVLKEISETVQKELRSIDRFCRWGGEEFIIILPETPKQEIQGIAERLRKSVEAYDFGLNRSVTISLGGIEINTDAGLESYEYLYKVDQTLYRSKEEGKNRLIICCDWSND